MSDIRQPVIRYRTSIWLFSFLILVLFGVFSIGIVVNVRQWGNQWRRLELNHFITTSQALELLLETLLECNSMLEGDWSARNREDLERLLYPFRLNTSDRVFFVNKKGARQIFPVMEDRPELVDFSQTNPHWRRGWDGIRSLTAEYISWDQTPVVASINPEDFSIAGPGVLIIFERNRAVFDWPEKRVTGFILFSILGLIFAYIVVLYYGRKMLQPFSRLEAILGDASSVKTDLIRLDDDFRDPVQRSIETFAGTIRKLREQEDRLEYLGDKLEQRMSPMDAYEEDLLASVNTGIITFDQNRTIMTLTSRVPQLLHLEKSDVRGSACEEVFGIDSEIYRVVSNALNRQQTVQQHQWRWDQHNRQPIWLSISTTLIQTPNGDITGVGCVVRDVTLFKRLRNQIREKQHLAALGELSAGVAHEFRNPLGAIQGNAQFLAESITESDLREVAFEICHEVSGLERIIRDFLNFARPVQPDVSSLDLGQLFSEEAAALSRQYDSLVQFSIEPMNEPRIAEIDENQFRQLIRNVLANACQAMQGRGDINVSIEPVTLQSVVPEEPDHYIIRVRDTGPGVPVDRLDEVFKPFYTSRTEGIGLGLAIVKKITLMHNGFVEFEKNTETGAVLRLTIPIRFDPEKTVILKQTGGDDLE
ncbi:PAS domain S-box protein [bacterium]|nr:PAS domain S-box protein [candidate division CSSED10-310 bacterium]